MSGQEPRIIRSLSQSVINKIAAGEVIERPASVVKELVENSVDAGSTRIDVIIEQGGADLIRIVDNGSGIAPDQLELALSPHATSKVVDADDLFHIQTFGFRGEALASIAEISQMSVKSRTAHTNEGSEIRSDGGARTAPAPCGMPPGSQIEVRNLFFNTPVRRKYMKTTTTEFGHICETFIRLALPQPGIHFTLKHNGKIVHELPAEESILQRIRRLFGEETASNLIQITERESAGKEQAIRVSGFVSHPSQSRGNNRMQYFFLNRRFIRDRALQHALNEAYRGILTSGRFPLAFLQLEMSPDLFDVNVHPTKMEVRFLDSTRVYSGFLGAVREKFLQTDLTSHYTFPAEKSPSSFVGDPTDPRSAMATPSSAGQGSSETAVPQSTGWAGSFSFPEQKSSSSGSSGSSPSFPSRPSVPSPPLGIHSIPARKESAGPETGPAAPIETFLDTSDYIAGSAPGSNRVAYTPRGKIVVQVHDSYLVMETENGIALVDQHALHERILLEQLKERIESGPIESQRLLVPIPVDLNPTELACVQENLDLFKTLGMSVESFGGGTVLISAFPAILSRIPPTEILLSVIEPILQAGKKPDKSDLLEKLLNSMACKAAIKSGDRISSDSMTRLLELAEEEVYAHHCPHGRPSTIVFTREELDKMFKRL